MLFPGYIHSILNGIFNEAGGSWLVVTCPFYDKRGSSFNGLNPLIIAFFHVHSNDQPL